MSSINTASTSLPHFFHATTSKPLASRAVVTITDLPISKTGPLFDLHIPVPATPSFTLKANKVSYGEAGTDATFASTTKPYVSLDLVPNTTHRRMKVAGVARPGAMRTWEADLVATPSQVTKELDRRLIV